MWIYVWNLGTLVSSWALNILTKRSQTLKTLKTFLKMAGTCNIRYEVINHKVTTTVILVECSLWLAAGTLLIKPIRRVKYGKAVKKIENLKMISYIFILNFSFCDTAKKIAGQCICLNYRHTKKSHKKILHIQQRCFCSSKKLNVMWNWSLKLICYHFFVCFCF